MTTEEVFSMLDARGIKGMMFHQQMADYFDFLNLRGYKRLHEYRFLSESAELRGLHRYYINHYNRLIPQRDPGDPKAIPDSWYRYSRQDVGPADKKKFILSAFHDWVEWETETKKIYEDAWNALCSNKDYAAVNKISKCLADVDMELKKATRMCITLKDVDADLDYVLTVQDGLHDEYDEKCKHIGVEFC